ncbi:MAG: phosphatidylglycerophosphatase A [Bacteroidales bacterium]|nr:phosphatidylglycerophosphatase A [Bacteroidales bacterium]
MSRPRPFDVFLTTGFYSGYSPFAPGTMGALVATLLWLLGYWLMSFWTLQIVTAVCIVLFTLISIQPINRVEAFWGEDPKRVVIDEVVGVWICLLGVPLTTDITRFWIYVVMAFALFRLFDIFKPLGIHKMEALPGGWGVMMDDILSGIYGLIVMFVCRWFFY